MDPLSCNFCQKKFSSKSNLFTHLKTAKYCLDNRNSDQNQHIETKCDFCFKKFTTKYVVKSHMTKCKEKLKQFEDYFGEAGEEKDRTITNSEIIQIYKYNQGGRRAACKARK